MMKISRRELFKRTGQIGIGGAALAVGLKTAGATTNREEANITNWGHLPWKDLPSFVYVGGRELEYVLQRPCDWMPGDGSGQQYEYFTKRSGRWRRILGGYWVEEVA